ncbi:hypothetical protein Tco_0996352 [Tanacetum coccineum]
MDTELMKESSKKAEAEITQESSSKRAGEALEQESSKTQKVDDDKETEELKQCMEIISDNGDDVTIEATPLSTKSPTIVDYKIYKEGKKSYFQIIRAYGNSHMYLTFGKMLKNIDKEDLEVRWSIHLEDNVWKNHQGLVKVLNWKLYDSCGVHCVTMQNILYYLLVEKMYPLTKHTLHQMFNDGRIVRIKSLLEVTAAKVLVTAAKRKLVLCPHDTQYCMKSPEQASVDYTSSRTNEVGGKRFTPNHGPRNFNDATNTWKEKPNYNWAHTHTFTSPQGGSVSVHSSSYQMKLEMALLDFDSNHEKRLSHLRTQLEQQQDDMIGKINLLWKMVFEKLNNVSTPENAGNPMAPKSIAAISHDEREELRKKGIKSP